jgi:predicted ThiF/HesA family dinucleotide-utilizing enzyme
MSKVTKKDCIPWPGRRCKDLTGKVIGTSTILGFLGKSEDHRRHCFWLRQCNVCGALKVTRSDYIHKVHGLHCMEYECRFVFESRLSGKRVTEGMFRQYLERMNANLLRKKVVDTSLNKEQSA